MGWLHISLRHTDATRVASVGRISGAVIAALLAFFVSQGVGLSAEALEKQPLTFLTADGKHMITVEVADTEQERNAGLMFRRTIGDSEGMIFLYPQEQQVAMWMKNTYLSLDMIFVRSNGTIHRIEEHTEPFSESMIGSNGEVRAVIEMKAGSADRLGLKAGDKVDYPTFR